MACEVCEHCHGPVSQNETFTVREGYSYHEKCHKCYVCSETNLQDAEVFKGVIFCSSCSQRIFQGCSTARKTKNTGKRTREKSHKRRSYRTQDRKKNIHDGILELTTLAVSESSDSSSALQASKLSKIQSAPSKHQTITVRAEKEDSSVNTNSMKKSSVEMGMTTEVTQELLKQMNCPVVAEYRKPAADRPKTNTRERKKKPECSDLRIAELGASTEIANMALRNKSELPVIIKSETRMQKMDSLSLSEFNQKSDDSGGRDDWMDSAYSSLGDSTRTHWMDRRLGSILKLPYKTFQRNILNRSSLISVLMSSDNDFTLMKRIKSLFNEEINDHQKRGLRRLYTTINRQKTPNKLGWFDTVTNACEDRHTQRPNRCQHRRCKHFRTSHSYRCMRAHVMRLAGPTASELAAFRNKVKNVISPGFFTNIGTYKPPYLNLVSDLMRDDQERTSDTTRRSYSRNLAR